MNAGFDPDELDVVKQWLDARVAEEPYRDQGYRVVIVRGGRLVAAWNHGVAVGCAVGVSRRRRNRSTVVCWASLSTRA